jgi:hypothetical protein
MIPYIAKAHAMGTGGGGEDFSGFLPLIFLFLVTYLLFRHFKKKREIKKQKEHQQMLKDINESDSKIYKTNRLELSENEDREIIDKRQKNYHDHIFISYRRGDSADVAGRIYDRLTDKFGKGHVFKDVDSIPLGADFREYIEESISNSLVLLVVIGKRWLGQSKNTDERRIDDSKDFARLEVAAALNQKIPIIPLLVLGANIPKESDLPEEIRDLAYRNGVPIRPDPDFDNDIDRLINGIENIRYR